MGPDRLTWGGDHTFFGVGVAVGTQLSIRINPNSSDMRVWRLFRALPHLYSGHSVVNISSLPRRSLGEHPRNETHEPAPDLEVLEPQPIGSACEPEIEIPQ